MNRHSLSARSAELARIAGSPRRVYDGPTSSCLRRSQSCYTAALMRVLVEHEMAVGGAPAGVFVTVVRGTPSAEGIGVLVEAFETWARTASGPLVTLTVPHDGMPLPSFGVRKAAADSMQRTDAVTKNQGVVLRGAGFWRSAARSVLTAMNTLARRRHALVFGSLQEACEWAAGLRGEGDFGVRRLLQEIEEMLEYAAPTTPPG